MVTTKHEAATRKIVYRTKGHRSGPITRLMSPSDLGHIVKPFVFLDLAEFDVGHRIPMDLLWHPHSGIATVTVMLEGAVKFAETTGKRGVLPKGSVEWMRAGNGVWHTGEADQGNARLFQLWIALRADLENAPFASHYVMAEDVPEAGPARVILGNYGGAKSPIDSPPLTYLQVNLLDGERWTFEPAEGQNIAWAAVSDGVLRTPEPVTAGEMVIFSEGSQSLDLVAEGTTRFVIGSAAKHPHDLTLGNYSVHTSSEALRMGEEEILRIGKELRANGTIHRRPEEYLGRF